MKYLLYFLFLFLLFGCSYQPDLSSISLKISKVNLDQLEFESISDSIELLNLETVSKEVLDFQFNSCLSIGSVRDLGTFNRFQGFKKDKYTY